MKSVGWEIRPVGVILLIVIVGVIGYFFLKWLQGPPSPESYRS